MNILYMMRVNIKRIERWYVGNGEGCNELDPYISALIGTWDKWKRGCDDAR